MHCQKVRENLAKYLAGECSPREWQCIDKHLADCAHCLSEKADLELLDDMLDRWCVEKPPPGITKDIMNEIQSKTTTLRDNKTFVKGARRASFSGLLRDLVVAAAVTLALFWAGGNWFSSGTFDVMGKNVNGMARNYTHITTTAVERVVSTADAYTGMITVKEWNLDEVYKSR